MPADLEEKTEQYERMLEAALSAATVAVPEGTPLGRAAADCVEMADAYLEDGRHFHDDGDPVNALAAYAYGYGWLDAGVRMGLFSIPDECELFTT